MLHALKNNWQPTAALTTLQRRAQIIQTIRHFFFTRGVLEVDTPLLSHATVTDPFVVGIPALFQEIGQPTAHTVYLQTSPEYAMKRLLAMGSGSIYQISKAFRQGDLGKLHNPEFTLLEWYRLGVDHHGLMDEMDSLLQFILATEPAERLSYAAVFQRYLQLDPHTATLTELMACAQQQDLHFVQTDETTTDRNVWLHLLLTHVIEPNIGQERPVFLYDFPVSQAALARIRENEIPPVASRFEVYFKGIELANGFHELQNAAEQRQRFIADLAYRKAHQLPELPIDEYFLAALTAGLPDCSGVALGIDRLIMLALGKTNIAEVMSFSFPTA